MSDALEMLRMLPDVRDAEAPGSEELMSQVAGEWVTVSYVKRTFRRTMPRPNIYVMSGRPNDYDEPDEPYTLAEQRQDYARRVMVMDWFAWGGAITTTESLNHMLREIYSSHDISQMAQARMPFAMMYKGEPPRIIEDPNCPPNRMYVMQDSPNVGFVHPTTYRLLRNEYGGTDEVSVGGALTPDDDTDT